MGAKLAFQTATHSFRKSSGPKSSGSAVIIKRQSPGKGAFAQLIGFHSKFYRIGLDRNRLLINDLTRSTELSCLGLKLSF